MTIKRKKVTLKDKGKLILFVVLIFILIAIDIIFYSKFIYNERSYYTENYLESDSAYKMDGKIKIEQTFIANENNLEAIALRF